jgi:predicted RNA methylase
LKVTEMPAAGWWEALWPSPATVLAAVGISSGMNVIDLCCGDGWFTLQIAKLAKRVVAIDIDLQLLDVARCCGERRDELRLFAGPILCASARTIHFSRPTPSSGKSAKHQTEKQRC